MKNIKLNLWVMIAACWLPLSILAQPGITSNRNVVLLHGLQETNGWVPFRNFFTNPGPDRRRMNADAPNFSSSGSLGSVAGGVSSSFFGSNSLTICHSLGGVVARRLDKANTPMGGIVTVGSPMDGAPIANAIGDGRAAQAVSDGINTMVRGPLASLGHAHKLITVFGVAIGAYDLPNLIGAQLNSSKFGGSAIINDIGIGGFGIEQDKNASPTNTPKISIWGNENSPIHWHLMQSEDGENWPNRANNLSILYEVGFFVHIGIAAWNWYNPVGWWSAYAAYEWYGGWQWIDNDSERIWNNLIGSDLVAEQCYTYDTQFCTYPDDRCDDTPSNWQYCQLICTPGIATACVQVHSNGISDAFISATSQRGDGSPSWRQGGGGLVSTIEAMGVNHKEEVQADNAEMRGAFNRVFSGEIQLGSGPSFQINRF